MITDRYGQVVFHENDLCELLYKNHKVDLSKIQMDNPDKFNAGNKKLHAGLPTIKKYQSLNIDLTAFDKGNQNNWLMPDQYKNFDIENWLYSKCSGVASTKRVEQELELYRQTNLLDLLKYIKYLVDTMTNKNILWGVGRGSSTSSYILYLIGLHMVDPLKYDIPIEEFFKQGNQNV